jgi:hypothetical protein
MIKECHALNIKYSAIAQPAYGARYCIEAGVEAQAETIIVYSIAPLFFNSSTILATFDSFCHTATYTHITPCHF